MFLLSVRLTYGAVLEYSCFIHSNPPRQLLIILAAVSLNRPLRLKLDAIAESKEMEEIGDVAYAHPALSPAGLLLARGGVSFASVDGLGAVRFAAKDYEQDVYLVDYEVSGFSESLLINKAAVDNGLGRLAEILPTLESLNTTDILDVVASTYADFAASRVLNANDPEVGL